MADYSFITIWRLAAPIERVFALIDDASGWPEWWPQVLAAEELEPGGEDRIGALHRLTFRGRLPYLLGFEMRVVRRQPPTDLEGRASGELEGVGRWALSESDGWTTVRYEWRIRTTRAWMNLLAPLPFVDAIFRLNHHAVMRGGLVAMRRKLGVPGEYERLD